MTQPDPGGGGTQPAPVTIYEYDLVDNPVKTTGALGHVTSFTYGALTSLTMRTDALNGGSTIGYEADGNVVASTDELGRVTTMQYDALNRRVRVVQPNPATGSPV